MKTFVIIMVLGIIVFFAGQSFACHIEFEAEAIENAKVGDVVTIEAIVIKEHRRCVLEDDDVTVELSENAKILKESGWDAIGNEIHNTFTIEITEPGETSLKISRECSKKGISENMFEFQVK